MKIKKMYQGTVPENKILNTPSDSQTDVYSCDYINKLNAYSTKVINTNEVLNSNNVLSIDTGIDDADMMWIDTSNSYIYNNNNTVSGGRMCYPIPFNVAPGETSTYVVARINGTKIELLSNGGWNEIWTKVITVKYTKGE